jgi:hypothetical protein
VRARTAFYERARIASDDVVEMSRIASDERTSITY